MAKTNFSKKFLDLELKKIKGFPSKLNDSENSTVNCNPIISDFFPDLFDYAHYFQKPIKDFVCFQQQWNNLCEVLQSRKTNLAQIRIQLQLQIDEAQAQLNAVQALIHAEQQLPKTQQQNN